MGKCIIPQSIHPGISICLELLKTSKEGWPYIFPFRVREEIRNHVVQLLPFHTGEK